MRWLPLAVLLVPSLGAGEARFVDVAAEAGIRFRHETGALGKLHYPEIMGAGVILLDADGDGDPDIYFLNGNFLDRPQDPAVTNALYRNDTAGGTPRFTDITAASGTGDPGYGQGGEAADLDGDGDQDLYVTNLGQDVLFRNEGGGRFAPAPLPLRPAWGQTCGALDHDHDGDLDLFVARYLTYDPRREPVGTSLIEGKVVNDYRGPQMYPGQDSVLLRNDGSLRFVDITREAGVYRPGGKGMGAACIDVDGDGWTDIYQSNDSMENYLFLNKGGKFEEMALLAGCAVGADGAPEASMGIDAADVDGNGRPDLMVPCLGGEIHTLYLDEWPWFTDASVARGLHLLTRDRTGFSPSFLDWDLDGDEDLFITCGRVRLHGRTALKDGTTFEDRYAEPAILAGNDGKRFVDAAPGAGPYFAGTHVGRGSAAGDLDGDGRPDLVVSHAGGTPAVLLDRTEGGRGIVLRLVGRGMNREAIGAKVTATVGGRVLHRWVRGGGSYLSVSDRRVILGLGEAPRAERIEIAWPLGGKTVLEGIEAGRALTVEEPPK